MAVRARLGLERRVNPLERFKSPRAVVVRELPVHELHAQGAGDARGVVHVTTKGRAPHDKEPCTWCTPSLRETLQGISQEMEGSLAPSVRSLASPLGSLAHSGRSAQTNPQTYPIGADATSKVRRTDDR